MKSAVSKSQGKKYTVSEGGTAASIIAAVDIGKKTKIKTTNIKHINESYPNRKETIALIAKTPTKKSQLN